MSPIQKDRSKDIPGKTGYSVRDIEKLEDVIRHPEKYGVEPDDSNGNGDDDDLGCLTILKAIAVALIIIALCLLVSYLVSGWR